MVDRERVELARLEVLDKVIADESLAVSTTTPGDLVIEATAVIDGDGTLALYMDGVKISEAVIRQPGIGPIYAICAVRAEAGIEYRVAMRVDGVMVVGSPRLRVLTDPPAPEDRLQPGRRIAADGGDDGRR